MENIRSGIDADRKPEKIETIVLSTQHDDFDKDDAMLAKIRAMS